MRTFRHTLYNSTVLEKISGAEGRTRTVTGLPLLDFESSASTNSTTPAFSLIQYTSKYLRVYINF